MLHAGSAGLDKEDKSCAKGGVVRSMKGRLMYYNPEIFRGTREGVRLKSIPPI